MIQPILKSLLLSALLATAGLAQAAERDVYLGAGVGSATTDRSGYDSSGAFKVFAGARVENFALELGYLDLGKFKQKSSGNEATVTGAQLNALGELFLSKDLYGFASFGFYNWSQDDKATGSDSGTTVTYGLGLRVVMNERFSVRGGWDRYQDIANTRVDLLSLGAAIHF